jgi:hypothetical protein
MPRIDIALIMPSDGSLRDLPNGAHDGVEIPSGVEQWHRFATCYKEAADRIAAIVAQDPWRHALLLGAPMMFLYRHYVEVHLKSLLLDAGELLDDPQAVPPKHQLQKLWDRVRALLLRVSPESDGEWFTRADGVIQELDGIDPTSFAFRYPVDKDSKPALISSLTVDAANVRRIVDELHILLDGASTQIDVYMGYKKEMY